MAALTPGTSLPFIPGMTVNDPTKQRFHLSQTLGFQNGYAMKNQPLYPIGGGKIELRFKNAVISKKIQLLDKKSIKEEPNFLLLTTS